MTQHHATTMPIPRYVAGRWMIDSTNSAVTFTLRHMLINTIHGRFNTFSGEITTGADPLESAVNATIETASLDTNLASRDEHIRGAEYLNVARYPLMVYRSTAVLPGPGEDFVVNGELTLKGVTHSVPLHLTIGGVLSPDPLDGTRIGLSATTQIDRHQFGIATDIRLAGGLVVARMIDIRIDVEAVLADE